MSPSQRITRHRYNGHAVTGAGNERGPATGTILAVAVGGAIGAVCRLLVASWIGWRTGQALAGTFAVNVSGALVMGIVAGIAGLQLDAFPLIHRLIVTGVLASYTTFSSVFLEAWGLFEAKRHWAGALYAGGTQIAGIIAVFAGMQLAGLP